ncbi:MAG TPA: DUF5684 domain-containing protein [bacterium]
MRDIGTRLLRWSWAALASASLAAAPCEADVVRLKNGSVVEGRVVSRESGGVVLDTDTLGRLEFREEEIASVTPGPAPDLPPFTHALALRNGNVLYGTVRQADGEAVTLDVPGVGVMTFSQGEVDSIRELTEEERVKLEAAQQARRSAFGSAQEAAQAVHSALQRVFHAEESAAGRDAFEHVQDDAAARSASVQDAVTRARELAEKTRPVRLEGPSGTAPAASGEPAAPQGRPAEELVLAWVSVLGVWLWVIALAVLVYYAVCLSRLAERTGTDDAWLAWVPVLHLYLACRVGERPGWWVLLYFVPFVNVIVDVLVWMGIATARGRPSWLGVLVMLPFVSWIVIGYLAFSSDGSGLALPSGATA